MEQQGQIMHSIQATYSSTLATDDVLAGKILERSLCCNAMACDIDLEAIFELHLTWCWHLDHTITGLRHHWLLPDVEHLHGIVSNKVGSKHCHLSLGLSS